MPTAHAVVTAAETAVGLAQKVDEVARRDAVLGNFRTHPAKIEMPAPTLPAALEQLAAAKTTLRAAQAAQKETYNLGLAAMRAPKIESVLVAAWPGSVHPEITDEMSRGEAKGLEGAAADAAAVIERLYRLHLGGMNKQDEKLLRQLFAETPPEMPTLALVHETTRRAEQPPLAIAPSKNPFQRHPDDVMDRLDAHRRVVLLTRREPMW